MKSEINKGVASIIKVQCNGCNNTFDFETSPKTKTNNGSFNYDINIRSVWGSISTGKGRSQLNELLGTMNSPCMSQHTFGTIEEQISEWWQEVLQNDMVEAGKVEKILAEERGDFFNGIPAITVITDGGWSKRSHKHSYSASGGVAIIIGAETKKILHVGVRNSSCYICATAENKNEEPKVHKCYKNWSKSPQAMEADIIVEGFKEAEAKHGLRYMYLIGDGDSSVYARVQEQVPVWGKYVKKTGMC